MDELCCGRFSAVNGSRAIWNGDDNRHGGDTHLDSHAHGDNHTQSSGVCCNSGDSVSILSDTCSVTPEGDREIDAMLLQYGDVFKVVLHSYVPTDGVYLKRRPRLTIPC